MIRRIVLENFMSHAHTVLDLAAGLNVLIGPNNCGKSAVVEALRAVCGQTKTDYMVRHGCRQASVTIETDDGHELIWRRRKDYASFCLDGVWNDRPRGEYFEQVQQILRLPRVRTSDGADAFDVHLGLQKFPIFLLNESELKQAAFFASSSDAEKLLEMQRRHRANVTDDRRALTQGRAAVAAVDARLATLGPVDELQAAVTTLREAGAAHSAGAATSGRLAEGIEALGVATRERDRQRRTGASLSALATPPAMVDMRALSGLIEPMRSLSVRRRAARATVDRLRPLRAVPALQEERGLSGMVNRLSAAQAGRRRADQRAARFGPLTAPPAWADDTKLSSAIGGLKRAQAAAIAGRRTRAAGAALRSLPSLADGSPLEGMIGDYRRMMNAVGAARAKVADAVRSADGVRAEILAWAAANPKCPTCDAPIDPARLLAEPNGVGEHAHA